MSKGSKRPQKDTDDQAYRLVYSTDPIPQQPLASTITPSGPLTLKPAVRIERKGRGGKTVTILFKLPADQQLLKELCAFLKRSVGGGGTFKIEEHEGLVELQGDHREAVLELAQKFSAAKR